MSDDKRKAIRKYVERMKTPEGREAEWKRLFCQEADARDASDAALSESRAESSALRAERDEARREENALRGAFGGVKRERDDARAEVARLTEVLRPFAAFKFGAKWAGHMALERDGDTNVLFGYGDDGQPTGVNVDYSDFERARAALSSSPQDHKAGNEEG